jgi:hypothetical protein
VVDTAVWWEWIDRMQVLIVRIVIAIWYNLVTDIKDEKKRHAQHRLIALAAIVGFVVSFGTLLYQVALTTPVDRIP